MALKLFIYYSKNPDIIFMDLDMPNLNGIETTQQIRRNKNTTRLKL